MRNKPIALKVGGSGVPCWCERSADLNVFERVYQDLPLFPHVNLNVGEAIPKDPWMPTNEPGSREELSLQRSGQLNRAALPSL